jgi:hypothetical protein
MRQGDPAFEFLPGLRLFCVLSNFVTQNCQPSQCILNSLIFFRRSAVVEKIREVSRSLQNPQTGFALRFSTSPSLESQLYKHPSIQS